MGGANVTQVDIERTLNHLGFDSVDDLHYWAKDVNELQRFDALCQQFAEHRLSATAPLVAVLRDCRAGLQYVFDHHGKLYGVGFDRCFQAADAAIAKSQAPISGEGG